MRGEHADLPAASQRAAGSSPHARGALPAHCGKPPSRRIIPACAGSTVFSSLIAFPSRDHPRMRGEHPIASDVGCGPLGSSPHARGALGCDHLHCFQLGIIPACAGSTTSGRSSRSSGRDHPRMRGEHAVTAGRVTACPGSSPHARGAPLYARALLPPSGIIPACAGSTTS